MIFSENALSGGTILVTGASSGIGRTCAIMISRAGARVVLSGRDPDRLEATRAALAGDGHVVIARALSGVADGHDLVVQASKDAGGLTGIFHAAGVAGLRSSKMISPDHVDDIFGSSIDAGLGIAKACAKRNVFPDGGAIVFMSSVAGLRGRAGMAAYSASRAAIGGLTRSLAAELAPRGIRVNEIVAGAIETEMHAQITQSLDESGVGAYRDLHLLGFGQPEDVAGTALFLLSDAGRWITGASIPVDGGYTAK